MRQRRLRGRRQAGLTLLELVLTTAILAVLVVLVVLAFRRAVERSRLEKCKSGLVETHRALAYYLNCWDEYLPLGWHVAGPSLNDDLGNLTHHRLLLPENRDSFRRRVAPQDVARAGVDREAALRDKFLEVSQFFSDAARGWTSDYFSPQVLFPIVDPTDDPEKAALSWRDVTKDVPRENRPVFADVNASYPDPKAQDPPDTGHEQEMRKGFSIVRERGIDIFIGVGKSLRDEKDPTSSRFDFRHRGKAAVIFLDRHIEEIGKPDAARLEVIHRNWNSLKPTGGAEGAGR